MSRRCSGYVCSRSDDRHATRGLPSNPSDRSFISPSHGYRAVHVIVDREPVTVEIQIRTALQHLWAELSERLADVVDSSIKYGGGDQQIIQILTTESELIAKLELFEKDFSSPPNETAETHNSKIRQIQEGTARMKADLVVRLRSIISLLKGRQR